jgi:hypothetical protein
MHCDAFITVEPWMQPRMNVKIQTGEMERGIRIVPGSRGAMTPAGPGMTAGAATPLADFGPGLLARQGRVEILSETRQREFFDFFKNCTIPSKVAVKSAGKQHSHLNQEKTS